MAWKMIRATDEFNSQTVEAPDTHRCSKRKTTIYAAACFVTFFCGIVIFITGLTLYSNNRMAYSLVIVGVCTLATSSLGICFHMGYTCYMQQQNLGSVERQQRALRSTTAFDQNLENVASAAMAPPPSYEEIFPETRTDSLERGRSLNEPSPWVVFPAERSDREIILNIQLSVHGRRQSEQTRRESSSIIHVIRQPELNLPPPPTYADVVGTM